MLSVIRTETAFSRDVGQQTEEALDETTRRADTLDRSAESGTEVSIETTAGRRGRQETPAKLPTTPQQMWCTVRKREPDTNHTNNDELTRVRTNSVARSTHHEKQDRQAMKLMLREVMQDRPKEIQLILRIAMQDSHEMR